MTKMTNSAMLVALAPFVFVSSVRAQLVSVRCCTEQADLQKIGDCVSGPGGTSQPGTCPAAATCVLGFGEDAQLMGNLCDPQQTEISAPTRGFCSEWANEDLTTVRQCVGKRQASVSLFSVFDDEVRAAVNTRPRRAAAQVSDGDLDLADLAVFHQVYDVTPKLVQSDAVLVYVECCVPEEVIRNIGQCLSGPRVTTAPFLCDGVATCVAGFSEPVEVGDYQHKLCASGEPVLPGPCEAVRVWWQAEGISPAHFCRASNIVGNTFFIVSDADGDADVDLADFAVFQREFENSFTD
ncbi:MAG: hypothetical protein V1790_01390 [Planctomycetota bacterium]